MLRILNLVRTAICVLVLMNRRITLRNLVLKAIQREQEELYQTKDSACSYAWLLQAMKRLGQEINAKTLREHCQYVEEIRDIVHKSNDYRIHVCFAMLLDICRSYIDSTLIKEYSSYLYEFITRIKTVNRSASNLLETALSILTYNTTTIRYKIYNVDRNSDIETCIAALQQALYHPLTSCVEVKRLIEACTEQEPQTPQQLYNQALAVAVMDAYISRIREKALQRVRYLWRKFKQLIELIVRLVIWIMKILIESL